MNLSIKAKTALLILLATREGRQDSFSGWVVDELDDLELRLRDDLDENKSGSIEVDYGVDDNEDDSYDLLLNDYTSDSEEDDSEEDDSEEDDSEEDDSEEDDSEEDDEELSLGIIEPEEISVKTRCYPLNDEGNPCNVVYNVTIRPSLPENRDEDVVARLRICEVAKNKKKMKLIAEGVLVGLQFLQEETLVHYVEDSDDELRTLRVKSTNLDLENLETDLLYVVRGQETLLGLELVE